MAFVPAGAGVNVIIGGPGFEGNLADNALTRARNESGVNLQVDCISSSTESTVGNWVAPSASILLQSHFQIIRRPGVATLEVNGAFTSSDQGIYTCTIDDADGNSNVINVGIYPDQYSG